MQKQKFVHYGYGYVTKDAADGGNSARIYVPKAWQGKECAVILLEPVEV